MNAKSTAAAASVRSAQHDTFVIERRYEFAPAKVFAAWADPAAKARWFVGPPDKWTLIDRAFDFCIGGSERLKGTFAGSGPVSAFSSHYLDIVPDARIVYSYAMHLDNKLISISLATIEFAPAGNGTRLVVTEQGVFVDGFDDAGGRERGTRALLDNLAAALQR